MRHVGSARAELGTRTIFNLLLSSDKDLVKNTDEVTHFDMLPTLLDLIGLRVVGDRAGLGYSALGPLEVPRPPDRMERMHEVLQNHSETYRKLWETEPPPPPPEVVATPDD